MATGAQFDAERPTEGFGLEGMRERAALMGGRLETATSGRGTVVEAHFPRSRSPVSISPIGARDESGRCGRAS
jgi:glucose-6-phosphate-specific signal transduction histidine kinase